MISKFAYLPLVIALSSILVVYDIQQAFGAGFTYVDYGSAQTPDTIVANASYVFVGSTGSDNVKVFNRATKALITTIASVTDTERLHISGDRVYSFDSDGSLIEIDAINHAILRTIAPACSGSTGHFNAGYFYCATGTETIKRIQLSSMTTVYTSTTANAGATPCDTIQGLSYDASSDTMFAGCNTTNRVVAIEDFLVSGTPDFASALTGARLVEWNDDNTNLFACSGSVAPQLLNYVNGAGFSLIATVGDSSYICSATPNLTYHSTSNRFILISGSPLALIFIDGTDGSGLYSQALATTANNEQVFAYSNDLIYGTRANTDDWFEFDTTGIPLGSEGGEEPAGGTNAVNGVCGSTDANGDGRVNVLDCVGNQTAWGGFTSGVPAVQVVGSITDGLGITDCQADGSDQDTCGSGLFFFILLLLLVEFLALAGYLGLTSKLNADKETIDVLLIMLIAGFAVLAIAFYLNWIPDLVFYTIIALIAGFLTFGLIAKLRGK